MMCAKYRQSNFCPYRELSKGLPIIAFFALSLLLPFSAPQAREKISLTQHFSFSPYPDARQQKVNEILQILAEGSGKLRVSTSLSLEVELLVEFESRGKELTEAHVFIQHISVSGDTRYKDFSLSHLLLPDFADLELALMSADDQVLVRKSMQGIKVSISDAPWFSLPFEGWAAAVDLHLEVKDFFFYFGELAFIRFERWGQGVEAYYDAREDLQKISMLLDGLYPVAAADIVTNEFRLCEAERLLGRISYGVFHHWLDLEAGDPLALIENLNILGSQAYTLRKSYNQYLQSLDSLLYREGMAMLKESSYAEVRPVFESVLNYNPFHIPSQLALVRADTSVQHFETALERLAQVHYQMFPSGIEKALMTSLADSLFGHFFTLADSLSDEGRHVQALHSLQHVVSYCQLTRGRAECPDALQPLLVQSHYGIYRSFLTVASRALRDGRPELAATYIRSAIEYQQKYQEFIDDAGEAKTLLYRLIRPAFTPMTPPG